MICPNFSLKDVRQEFDELQLAVGEDLAYYLWDKNGGYHLDKTNTGKESKLYKDLVDLTGNRVDALKIKAKTFTATFKEWYDNTEEPVLQIEHYIPFISNGRENKIINVVDILTTKYDNTQELEKIKVSDPISQIMEDFEKYFPDLAYYNQKQREITAQLVNDGLIRIEC